jgi:AcrR family transcriptional regulator
MTSTDTTISDTAGTDTAGTDTAGTDTAGTDTAGTDTAGTDTAGTKTPGPEVEAGALSRRPMRADARRNFDKLIAAGREAFTEDGSSASLEEIARRAGVGIGTLYRHFPSRQELLEAVYVEEVEALCRSADDFAGLAPWDALDRWLHQFVGYMATKQALAEELFAYLDRDADVFKRCSSAFYSVGGRLLERAQQAGAARSDTDITEVIRMVAGISKIPSATPEQIHRVLSLALDGLRSRPAAGDEPS